MLETLLSFVAVHPLMTLIVALLIGVDKTLAFLIWMAILIFIFG